MVRLNTTRYSRSQKISHQTLALRKELDELKSKRVAEQRVKAAEQRAIASKVKKQKPLSYFFSLKP